MKYKSSYTRGIKVALILIFLFWLINTLVIINSNGIRDAIVSSSFMIVFVVAYILFFVNGIYIIVENNNVKYVHMFFLRREVEIVKINRIQKSLMGGFYDSLSLLYEENGKTKGIKIGTVTFNKNSLKQFVSDLKNRNSNIVVDQSVEELIS